MFLVVEEMVEEVLMVSIIMVNLVVMVQVH